MDWKRLLSGSLAIVEILVVIAAPMLATGLIVLHRQGSLPPNNLAAWTVALLGLLSVSLVFERYKHFRKVETGIEQLNSAMKNQNKDGGVVYLSGREHTPSFAQLVGDVKKDILLVMLAPAYIAYYQRDLLETLVMRGVSIRFLLPSPGEGDTVDPIIPRIAISGNHRHFPSVHREIINNLQSFRESLQEKFRGNVHIRVYDCAVPSLNLTVVDPTTARGKVLLELLPFKFAPADRPALLVTNGEDKTALFGNIVKNYEELWQMSRDI